MRCISIAALLLLAMLGLGACGENSYARTKSTRADGPPTRGQERGRQPEARDPNASVSISGRLTPRVRDRMRAHAQEGRAVIVVLRKRDVESCENLGRQLREALRATGRGTRGIVVVDPGAEERVHGFLRREHLHLVFEVLSPDSLFADGRHVPTPAMLVLSGSGLEARGVAHPNRFANIRLQSFAAELQPLLP